MDNLDKIVEFLWYHPGVSRPELMAQLDLGVGDTQVKKLLAEGLSRGDIRVEGHARATRYFITPKGQLLRTINLETYYAVPLDQRAVQTTYNFNLIRDELPSIDIFTKEEYAFLAEQERIFLEQVTFAVNEYF